MQNVKNIKIAVLFPERVFNLFRTYCVKYNITFADELKDFDFDSLINQRGIGIGKIEKIKKRYEEYLNGDIIYVSQENRLATAEYAQMSIKDRTESLLRKLSTGRSFDIYLLRSEGFTLQEIAEEYNITRERIRQLANKFYRIVHPAVSELIIDIMQSEGKKYIAVDELIDFFDNNDFNRIILHTLKSCPIFEFLDFADLFLLRETQNQDTENDILQLAIDIVGEGINLYKELDVIEEILEDNNFNYVTADSFINLLLKHNYRIYGDFVVRGRQSYGFLCARLVKEHFKSGIRIYSDEDLNRLRELAQKTYGNLNLPSNNRAFGIRLSEFLVLCGRGMATASENISIDMSTLESIKDYIDNISNAKIFYREIYEEFQGLLFMTSNVDNYHFLHGVISYYYPNEYIYSRDALIKMRAGKALSLSDRMTEFIKETGRAVHKNDIRKELPGISDIMLYNAVCNEPKIIKWGHNYYNHIDNLGLSNHDLAVIKEEIDKIIAKFGGYCSSRLLFKSLQNRMGHTIQNNQITNAAGLFYTAGYYFRDLYNFNSPHITSLGRFDGFSTKSIAYSLLDTRDQISASSFFKLAKSLRWSEVTAYCVFTDIEKDCIQLSNDNYVLKHKFSITPMQLEEIKKALSICMKDISFLPVVHLSKFDDFPHLNTEWNEFLIASIIEEFGLGYKIINPQIKDRRYQKGIIVRSTNKIQRYDELVAFVMREQGQNNLSEYHFLSFLVINGLALKTIPKELYNSEYVRLENDKFVLGSQ